MKSWLITLWQIALMRAGPQDLPGGSSSPVLALVLYCAVVLVSGLIDDRTAALDGLGLSISVAIVLPLIAPRPFSARASAARVSNRLSPRCSAPVR